MSRVIQVECDVDIQQTQQSFHAYAVPDGIEIQPGDTVLVHNTPVVGFGGHVTCRCPATVTRGGPLARLAAHLRGFLELTDLYEVGFQPEILLKDAA
jgi:hypothetical protein